MKMGTKNKPGKFDCYSKAEPDEPVFVLLGRDPTAAFVVAFWAGIREKMGEDAEKLGEAMECAQAMEQWARDHGKGVDVDSALGLIEQAARGQK